MLGRMAVTVTVVGLLAATACVAADEWRVVPTDPVSLGVVVGPGKVTLADGTVREIAETRLTMAGPEVRAFEAAVNVPGNYLATYENWDRWPGTDPKKNRLAVALGPPRDEVNTPILGGLYGALVPGSLRVTSEDGTRLFAEGTDYVVHRHWPQIMAVDARLGAADAKVRVSCNIALQRLDLLQVSGAGELSIKRGKSVLVCPELPEADAGHRALAGIYVAPWKTGEGHAIPAEHILPIRPVAPAAPVNPGALSAALEKLRAGQDISFAFLGDSVTLGAEAGAWWEHLWTEKNQGYASRVVVGLRQRFPKATITPIAAFKGGITTSAAAGLFEREVAAKRPDVLVIAFGLNDADGPLTGGPKNPPAQFKKDVRAIIAKAKESGTSVLLVTPFQPSPFRANGVATRILDYRKALLELAEEEQVACADVYTDWMSQASRGIPPFSQLHNWINHPGPVGHALYAETILRFFPVAGGAEAASAPAAEAAAPGSTPRAAVRQPTTLPGKFEYRAMALPALDGVLKKAEHNPRIYGLYTWTNEYTTHRDSIRKVGWKSVRHGGPFSDEIMARYVEDQVEVMVTLANRVALAARPGVDAEQDAAFAAQYAEAVSTFLKRYGPDGAFFKERPTMPHRPIRHIELWNEPNFQYLIKPDGRPQKELEAAREALYAKMLPAVYALKEEFPQVQFVGFAAGGSSAGDLRFVKNVHDVNAAVARSYDIFATHPYVDPAPPEAFSIRSWGSYSIASSLATLRETLAAHGRGDVPVWYTEIGWPVSQADGGHFPTTGERVSPQLQAAYVCRLYALSQRLGVERVHIMFATDTDNFNAGFFLRDGSWRPSAHAVATMVRLLPAPKLLGAVSDGEGGYFAYRFASQPGPKGREVLMLWNVEGPRKVKVPASGTTVEVTDMLGGIERRETKGGELELEAGPLPVYVTWR